MSKEKELEIIRGLLELAKIHQSYAYVATAWKIAFDSKNEIFMTEDDNYIWVEYEKFDLPY